MHCLCFLAQKLCRCCSDGAVFVFEIHCLSMSLCDFDMIALSWSGPRAHGPWAGLRAQSSGLIVHGSMAMGQRYLARGQSAKVRRQGSDFMGSGCFLQAMDFELGLQKHRHMHMNIMKLQKLQHWMAGPSKSWQNVHLKPHKSTNPTQTIDFVISHGII